MKQTLYLDFIQGGSRTSCIALAGEMKPVLDRTWPHWTKFFELDYRWFVNRLSLSFKLHDIVRCATCIPHIYIYLFINSLAKWMLWVNHTGH